ncbi:uridylate-specific endoribonuclease [Hyperolius riggenbachi]|uniref:uridylate-specific endoribonuclease n=1 Tax=Hyperolius riggenbachi TaxID=752182 RepID=UPI0035A2820F
MVFSIAQSLEDSIISPALSSTMKKLVVLVFLSLIGSIWTFETCSSERCEDSCKNRCGDKPNHRYTCQCNERCQEFRDCCDDYSICKYIDPSFNEADHYETTDQSFKKASKDKKTDTSCNGRCGEKFNKKHGCHCNKKCPKFGNCCDDYDELCGGGGSSTTNKNSGGSSSHKSHHRDVDISNEEIRAVSEKLYQSDHNKAEDSDIKLNKQEMVEKNGIKKDLCDEPLYQYVNEDLFQKPTFAAFIKLLDNYDRKTGTDEECTSEELKEQELFLKEIMKTKVMKELYSFFNEKGMYQAEEEFLDDLQNMWFGLYSRSAGVKDSSGFEHVFVGEVKKGIVSGFHSWVRFYFLEKKGMLNYYNYNYDGPWTSYPDVLGKQFHWDGFLKEVGSQFIGSSPEFELAMYTLCFIARPGKKCTLSMDGHNISIQTYQWTKSTYGNGRKYIATAYPVV